MTAVTPEWAYQAGRYARQASRERGTCPMFGITEDARAIRDRWRAGWDDEDRLHAKPAPQAKAARATTTRRRKR